MISSPTLAPFVAATPKVVTLATPAGLPSPGPSGGAVKDFFRSSKVDSELGGGWLGGIGGGLIGAGWGSMIGFKSAIALGVLGAWYGGKAGRQMKLITCATIVGCGMGCGMAGRALAGNLGGTIGSLLGWMLIGPKVANVIHSKINKD